MFNDAIKFKATEANREINVSWYRQHIAGYEETLTTNGELYCITVYTTVRDKTGANKQFLLFGDQSLEFIDWFHDSY
jgi:hypothetical protein